MKRSSLSKPLRHCYIVTFFSEEIFLFFFHPHILPASLACTLYSCKTRISSLRINKFLYYTLHWCSIKVQHWIWGWLLVCSLTKSVSARDSECTLYSSSYHSCQACLWIKVTIRKPPLALNTLLLNLQQGRKTHIHARTHVQKCQKPFAIKPTWHFLSGKV